jgi:hypothetical protein
MAWKNIDTGLEISNHHYKQLSPEEKTNWREFDDNKVEHGDLLNTVGGGLIGDFENDDDD